MQKKIIALAIAAAFAAPVAAQAEVTMYGSMDGGLRHQTNDKPSAGTTDTMQMGQYNTARFGFKGVDDMGDGMKATVVLETSLAPGGVGANPNTNTGTPFTMSTGAVAGAPTANGLNPFGLLFDRQATIGLSGGFGSFDMGWNYTTSFSTIATYDPFNYKFLGVAGAKTSDVQRFVDSSGIAKNQDRAGNLIYKNKFGDVGIQLEYDVNNGDKASQPAQGPGRALGVTYASGPVNVGFAYTAIEPDLGQTNATTHMTAGAGFNFGDGKVSIGYAKNTIKVDGAPFDDVNTNMWAGASFKMSSKIEVTAAYYKKTNTPFTATAGTATTVSVFNFNQLETSKNTAMVGLTYSLSKATTAYLEFDRTTSNSLTANGTTFTSTLSADAVTTGTSFGLNTSF